MSAAAALAFAVRSLRLARDWLNVPLRPPTAALPSLSIVVPARNEERNIERCVRSLLAQELPDVEVIVVDDRSTDATRSLLTHMQTESARLQVVDGEPLPEGWVGKPWALVQGARHARGEWILFTDADSAHHPYGSASALRYALERGVALLTIAPHQELVSFWERAVLPAILWMIFFASGPLECLNDPADTRHALANGQYMLFERRAYEALGSHAAVRGEMVEDVEFARLIKRDGRFRMIVADGRSLASVRMYHTFGEIWNGFVKNVYFGANGNLAVLGGVFAFTSALSWLPPFLACAALLRGRRMLALEATLCTLTTIVASRHALGSTRIPRRLSLYTPMGLAVLAAIIATSTYRVFNGGVEWRGRSYGRTNRRSP